MLLTTEVGSYTPPVPVETDLYRFGSYSSLDVATERIEVSTIR